MGRFKKKIALSKPWYQYSDVETHSVGISSDEYETIKAYQEESHERAYLDGYGCIPKLFEEKFRELEPETSLSGWSRPAFANVFEEIRDNPALFGYRIKLDVAHVDISGAKKTGSITLLSDDDVFDAAHRGDIDLLFWDIFERRPVYVLATGEMIAAPKFQYSCDWTDVERRKGEITRAVLKVIGRLGWSAERTKRFVRQSTDERDYR